MYLQFRQLLCTSGKQALVPEARARFAYSTTMEDHCPFGEPLRHRHHPPDVLALPTVTQTLVNFKRL